MKKEFVIIKSFGSCTSKIKINYRINLNDIKSYFEMITDHMTYRNFYICVVDVNNNSYNYYFDSDKEMREVLYKLDEIFGAVDILNKIKNE